MNSISYVIKKVLLDILSNEICRKSCELKTNEILCEFNLFKIRLQTPFLSLNETHSTFEKGKSL